MFHGLFFQVLTKEISTAFILEEDDGRDKNQNPAFFPIESIIWLN